ncbi:hypothetical protein MOV08_05290 [Streptomyces yunnanensis]|uniref:Gas vesicle protein G n=1 Tax=Streptomyces yunnanensis TaxID=156453 RepID=A0ABY8A4F2_9ACTN|nr:MULTISPECIES: hypothetical protein [Streptomyces]WEB38775.1 hypothetical protein MOV08_05290 [Streptomyces yunnanensis]
MDHLVSSIEVLVPVLSALVLGLRKYRSDVVNTLRQECQEWQDRSTALSEELKELRDEVIELRKENYSLRAYLASRLGEEVGKVD